MKNIFNFLKKDKTGNPPWNYYFLQNLEEKEYPLYLAKLFKLNTGENLPLKYDFKNRAWVIDKKRCKTFNQKIQWIKLYGVTDLMRRCTDKVAVRDYVAEKIGEEYLKPVLQIIPAPSFEQSAPLEGEVSEGQRGVNKLIEINKEEQKTKIINKELNENEEINKYTPLRLYRATSPSGGADNYQDYRTDVSTYFDQIQWDKLPNSFVIKCNHGCKWQYIIKDKEQFLNTPQLFETVKRNITGWLEQDYSFWGGFEMQYKVYSPHPNPPHPGRENVSSHYIVPKILIEPLMRDDVNTPSKEIMIFFFNSEPKIILKTHKDNEISLYDENLNYIDDVLSEGDIKVYEKADDLINQTFDLSNQLIKNTKFKFVRIDWMIYQNKPYFEEFTFTPYSGMQRSINKKFNKALGIFIDIERGRHGF